MLHSFEESAKKLNESLKHAFRYGVSAFRFGIIQQSVSDHLPITTTLPFDDKSASIMSWNLLADEHLFNNFRNISGSDYLEKALDNALGSESENIYHGSMFHLFSEIAQYLYKKSDNGNLSITPDLLKGFVPNAAQPSRRALSRDIDKAKAKQEQVEKAREKLVEILCDTTHERAHEFQLALRHSLELIYHIEAPQGALRWQNRFSRLKENKSIVKELCAQDILAFQECTSPKDMEDLLRDMSVKTSKKMKFITHNLSKNNISTDNVVLAYDANQFELVGEPLKSDFHGKKPALYCKLRNIKTHSEFIIGSIHHPGGATDYLQNIHDDVKRLQGSNTNIPFYIAGDYNHTAEQFSKKDSTDFPKLHYPRDGGTMAGSDFGNGNQGIDAVMSNHELNVQVSPSMLLAPPAPCRLNVRFDLAAAPCMQLAELTFKPFIITRNLPEAKEVAEALKLSNNDDDLPARSQISFSAAPRR